MQMIASSSYLGYFFLTSAVFYSISSTQEIVFNGIVISDWTLYRTTSQIIPGINYKWPKENEQGQIVLDVEPTGYSAIVGSYYALLDTSSNIVDMVYPHEVTVDWDSSYVKQNTTVLNVKCRKQNDNNEYIIPSNFTLGQYKNVRYSKIECFLRNISRAFLEGLGNLKWLDLTNNNITKVDQHVFDDLIALEELELSRNPISSLSKGLFCTLPQLKILRLNDLRLTIFPSELFHPDRKLDQNKTCLGNLETLDFSNNRLGTIKSGAFSEMTMLKNLTLRNCSIHTLEAYAFKGLTQINYIYVEHNWIKDLPDDLFVNMSNLQTLGLSFNNLTYFSFDLLFECKALIGITLKMNRIEWIGGTAEDNKGLIYVDLSGNSIQYLPPDMFRNIGMIILNLTGNQISMIHPGDHSLVMPRLDSLDLMNNNLTILVNNSFYQLGRLKNLFLLKNRISELEVNSFAGLRRLEALFLGDNNIRSLPLGIFKELQNLKILSLKNNSIVSLYGASFEGLVALEEIYLGHNKIRRIDTDTFNCTKVLQKMLLHSNFIEVLPNGLFQNFRREIKSISLYRNKLSTLPADLFTGFSRLRDVNISRNSLRNLSDHMFDGCNELQIVDLSYNNITEFNVSLRSLGNLRHLYIRNNQLVDAWNIFKNMNFMYSLIALDLSWNKMTSLGPVQQMFTNKWPLLEFVNISHNFLTAIPYDQFYLSPQLKGLDLSYNNIKTLFPIKRIQPSTVSVNITANTNAFICDCHMLWVKVSDINATCTIPAIGDGVIHKMSEVPRTLYLCRAEMACPENCECFADQIKEPNTWIHVRCSNKGLTYIPTGIPESAQILDVSNNAIKQLDSTTFHSNVTFWKLETLDMSNNEITALIGDAIFTRFYVLTSLKLNNNMISRLSGEPFKSLPILGELHLANNSIMTVEIDVFSRLNSLYLLDLEGNQLQDINPHVFDKLTWMVVGGYKTKQTQYGQMYISIKFKRLILLSKNPWNCCRSLPLKKWLNNHQAIIPNLADIHCMRDNITESVPLFQINDANLTCTSKPPVQFQQTSYFRAIVGVLTVVSLVLLGFLLVKRFKSHIKLKLFVWFGWRFDRIENDNRQYDAFLSYNGLNGEWVRDELLTKLEDAGYRLCLHERDFRVGEPIIDNINNAIDNSKRTIIVLSNEFLEGGYTIYEFVKSHDDWVRGERDPVILILYDPLHMLDKDELEKHPTLNTYIATRTYLDRNNRYFWENIILAMPRQRRQAQNEMLLEQVNLK